jgi:DGQHR domain-containing protein
MKILRYSSSTVTQSRYRFYTMTMPSSVLARTCFVISRNEDPKLGFQRLLDRNRAQQIADYIDAGLGTIPTSIVLSAQADANLKVLGRGKTIEFHDVPKAFLILDGQHRVYGFSLAKSELRVPVVVYNGLSRRDESRLFIDINTKQKPVPNELLLDIRKLAEYQEDIETLLGLIYDSFNTETDSPLMGLLSPSTRQKGKISRVTFNRALKPHIEVFGDADTNDIYLALASYVRAFMAGLKKLKVDSTITNPTVFRAALLLFPEVGQRLVDRFGKKYTSDNFYAVLAPLFDRIKASAFKNPGGNAEALRKFMSNTMKSQFTL